LDAAAARKVPDRYFTFFGLQSFFFFDETTPQSLQRKSPGFAFRIGLPRWHDIASFQRVAINVQA
jgi:hypothetical protein